MINSYGIYNHHELNNTLLVLFSDSSITRVEKIDEVEVLYHNEEKVGYRINNFIRYAKIKYSGIIFLPADPLIDIINVILKNHKLDTLAYKNNSGYFTKKYDKNMLIYANPGVFLRDGTISKGRFCTYYDLFMKSENENDLVTVLDNINENEDFFKMEVK